jgi:hypothetical protein
MRPGACPRRPHTGDFLTQRGTQSRTAAHSSGVEAHRIEPRVPCDEDRPLVVEALADHGEPLLPEHRMGPHHRVVRAEAGVVQCDGAAVHAGGDQGATHGGRLVVVVATIVATEQQMVHLACVVQFRGRSDAMCEEKVGAAVAAPFRCTQHHADMVVGHLGQVVEHRRCGGQADVPVAPPEQHHGEEDRDEGRADHEHRT